MDQMINYILLAWKLAYKLRTYRACNSNIRFSKYEFNNKLLGGGVILLIKVFRSFWWEGLAEERESWGIGEVSKEK